MLLKETSESIYLKQKNASQRDHFTLSSHKNIIFTMQAKKTKKRKEVNLFMIK
jgi:hypothetical protein